MRKKVEWALAALLVVGLALTAVYLTFGADKLKRDAMSIGATVNEHVINPSISYVGGLYDETYTWITTDGESLATDTKNKGGLTTEDQAVLKQGGKHES